MNKPSVLTDYTITYLHRDTGGYRITSQLLEKVINEAKKVKKKAKIIITLQRNDKTNYILDCEIKIEKK